MVCIINLIIKTLLLWIYNLCTSLSNTFFLILWKWFSWSISLASFLNFFDPQKWLSGPPAGTWKERYCDMFQNKFKTRAFKEKGPPPSCRFIYFSKNKVMILVKHGRNNNRTTNVWQDPYGQPLLLLTVYQCKS